MTLPKTAAKATLALTAAAAALAATGPLAIPSAQGASTKAVHIKNIRFSPTTLRVARGTTVRWTFEDRNTPHNVTSRGAKRFRSSHTQQSGSYSVRFNAPGTYRYVCTIHFNMKASIVVR